SSSVAMTVDKPITSTGSGRLTIDNSTFTLSNTNNNWAGPMTVSSGILTLGAAGVIPDTCAVTLSGGDLATGGFAETIDTLIVTSSGSAITGVGPLTVNTLIDLRASSTIGTTVIAGAANASKTTTGMATLTGANTYSGGTALSAGVLRVGNNSALGTGKLTLVSGRLSGNSSTARTLSVPVDLSGNVTLGTNTVDTGNLTFQTGAWTITGATRTITTDTNTISINSAIGEDAPGRGLIKAGAIGILALNNPANTYSGDTTISAGTINVDGDGSFGNGAGAINLAGGNIGVTADRGVSSANIINRVNMTANAEIMAATATGTRNIVFGGVWTTTSGTLTLHSTQVGVGPATLNVRFTNAFTFSQPITFAVDTAGNFVNLDVWNRADLGDQTYNGLISGPGSIKRSISTAGTGGKVTFTQQNTYSGGTSLNDGEIALGSDCTGSANAPTAGPLGTGTVTIGNDVGRLSASAASRNLFNRILFSATGTHLALLGSNDLELSGNVDLAGQSVTITNLNTGVARISGVIGNGALTKDGAGTLVLSGANTYAGTTTVSAGLLDAAAAGSLGTNSVNVASGATLQLDAVGAIGSSANLVLGSGALPVNLNFAGVSNIRALSFDGGATFQDAGTWGATGSGATHIDDAHFAGAGQLSVALAGSITSLATDGSPSTYGNTVTFTATVTGTGGTPTGSVTFKDSASTIGSGVLNGSGVATLAIASLPSGARSITAVYAGDGTFVGSTSSAVTQTVNQAVLTVTATGVLVYGNDPTNAVYTPFYAGLTNSDTTNVISGKATFSTDAASTSYIGSNYITHVVDMGTLSAANYSFVAGPDGALAVTNRPLSVTNVLANAKDYDGTATATLNSAGAGLSGLVNGDEASVTLDASAATGLFNNKNAGIGKAVQVSGMTTAGDLGTNYYVIQPATAATISQTNITVTAAANSKTYDGTTNAAATPTITAGSLQATDAANFTETYDTRNVGTGKTLTPAGSVTDGNGGANYAVTFANDITGEIIAKPITVTAVTGTKMYDGGTTSTGVPTVSPSLVAGDTANFTQAFANKNAGMAKTLVPAGSVTDGNGGANYAVTFANDTTGEITTKPITVTAVTGTKVYDGGTTSAGVPTVTPGVASGDTANFTQGYDSKNVGTGKTLTPTGSVTDGNGGANYAVTFANDTTGEITAKPITVTAVTGTKMYDGGT
ncbi:MAG: YDG domain-containing protein, partial [Verrucomicrobiota bacterium]